MVEGGGASKKAKPRRGEQQLQAPLLPPPAAAAAAASHWGGWRPCRRCVGCLRWARHELVGFSGLLLAGVVLGLALPTNAKLSDPRIATLSNVLGWTYFLAWTVSFYPQIIMNHRRRTTAGLSLDFELLNLLGFAAYTAFASAFYGSARVQAAYAERHGGHGSKVTVQDLFFAAHAVGITLVTIAQMLHWDGAASVRSRLSWPISFILGLLLGGALLGTVLAATAGKGRGEAWLHLLYFLSYEKLFISAIKGIPQAYLNYRRASTEGWSIHNILCDFTGGLLSVLQLCLDCWATDDWSGIRGDPLKFGLGIVSMTFDLFFCFQHFWLYPQGGAKGGGRASGGEQQGEEEEEEEEQDEDILV